MENISNTNNAQITVLTRVHNPGNYIYRCVESVLNQTYPNFRFVIIDNASSDGTKEILEDYAKKDSRICLMRNELNNISVLYCLQNYIETKYFMILDHDDWLESNALEVLVNFAETESADIVFGRTNFVNEKEEFIESRGYNECFVGSPSELVPIFPYVYWQFRTTWASLIKKELIASIDADTYNFRAPAKYGGDTVLTLSMTFSANRIGFVNKIIHNYRMHSDSESYTFCRDRFIADWTLFDFAKKLLEEKNGFTEANQKFLYLVYCNAIYDTLNVAIKSKQNYNTLLEILHEILQHTHTRQLLFYIAPDSDYRKKFIDLYGFNLLLLFKSAPHNPAGRSVLYLWFHILYPSLNLSNSDYDLLIHDFLVLQHLCRDNGEKVYHRLFSDESDLALTISAHIKLTFLLHYEQDVKILSSRLLSLNACTDWFESITPTVKLLASQNKLLRGVSDKDFLALPEVVLKICAGQYSSALTDCLNVLESNLSEDIYGTLQIAIRLSALLEQAPLFIDLKKLECEYWILNKKYPEATHVLADLIDMCPNDTHVMDLQSALNALSQE